LRWHKRLTLIASAIVAASSAHAVILTPDVFTALPGTLGPGGTVIEDVLQPFSFSAYGGTVSGQVQSRVVRKGDGTLLFAWRMFNDANSSGNIQDLRLVNFVTSVYDADWDNPSLGDMAPTRALLFSMPGGFVNFNFNQASNPGGLIPRESSKFFYLNTNETKYAQVGQYDLANLGQTEISVLYSTFAPVPEPATLAVLGIGILALARRKKRS
jgi:PEP-CTERM motif